MFSTLHAARIVTIHKDQYHKGNLTMLRLITIIITLAFAALPALAGQDDEVPTTITFHQRLVPNAEGIAFVQNLGGNSACDITVNTTKPIEAGTTLSGTGRFWSNEKTTEDMAWELSSGFWFRVDSVTAEAICNKKYGLFVPSLDSLTQWAAPYFTEEQRQ